MNQKLILGRLQTVDGVAMITATQAQAKQCLMAHLKVSDAEFSQAIATLKDRIPTQSTTASSSRSQNDASSLSSSSSESTDLVPHLIKPNIKFPPVSTVTVEDRPLWLAGQRLEWLVDKYTEFPCSSPPYLPYRWRFVSLYRSLTHANLNAVAIINSNLMPRHFGKPIAVTVPGAKTLKAIIQALIDRGFCRNAIIESRITDAWLCLKE